jgi:hypothetical protein
MEFDVPMRIEGIADQRRLKRCSSSSKSRVNRLSISDGGSKARPRSSPLAFVALKPGTNLGGFSEGEP